MKSGSTQTDSSGNINISIIGAISGAPVLDEARLEHLLEGNRVELAHRGAFTGKPETSVYADNEWVLKVNGNRKFSSRAVAEKWCVLQIEKERQYGIYHASRSWFVFQQAPSWLAANVTRRMQALHTLDFQELSADRRLELLGKMLGTYLGFVARQELRLDEGLSNFGLYDDKLCYLDDDIYPWDGFSSFSAMIGNLLRQSPRLGLDEALWRRLGETVAPMLRGYSSDARDMVCEATVDQIVGAGQEALKQAFLAEICPKRASFSQAVTGRKQSLFDEREPIALIADVHANLPAFRTLLDYLEEKRVRQVLILGDLVGYGPNPNECIALIRKREMICIRGNHDHYAAHDGDVRVAMGVMARWTADWTLTQLDEDSKQWLGELPVRLRSCGWMAVHGSPVDKSFFNGYVYNMTCERNLDHLVANNIPLCLHGHSHIQGVYARRKGVDLPFDKRKGRIELAGLDAALICPGSAGQPRGGESAVAEAALFYPHEQAVEMIALPYDIEPVIADMEANGFPEQLVSRLREGR